MMMDASWTPIEYDDGCLMDAEVGDGMMTADGDWMT
jgi:hypothetical protein